MLCVVVFAAMGSLWNMAARLRKTHQSDVRQKIQASQIINRLSDHLNGKADLSPTQLRAAEILLKKTLPDLSSVDIGNKNNEPFMVGMEWKNSAAFRR